ncbi:DEAD/DEAH box helicase [Diaphorobacter sp.]|uniref:DEAD/DEAH box helicase n=1 Tax=Diaphorobacter sp. TaxID=1934310 RepID=UPI0025904D7D|nr:DEAD/DEAH box helicase [Diaphorobacter sp.]
MTFEELKLAPAILRAVQEQGYDNPTPIQAQAIPAVLAGHDLLAGAQTGTGKTAAFTLPMLHRLAEGQAPRSQFGGKGVRALVLTPTRELAAQVEESVRGYGKYLDLNSTVIFGGVGMNPQIERIKRGVDVLVATPGRLLDLQQQGFMDLSTVEILVLDEADRMLDMGFIHDVKKVLALLPQSKQSLLFSATFSDDIRELANSLLKNPQSIQVTPRNTTVQRISQVIHPVGRGKKKQVLLHIIQEHDWSQVLVFTRTKFGANNVAEYLTKNGVSAMALHGNKSQSARTQALEGFKTGQIRALVATDIAARGIDIDDLPHVVNYEIPNVPEDYVHRIGRTGRAGAAGHAISLVDKEEANLLTAIERLIKRRIDRAVAEDFVPSVGGEAAHDADHERAPLQRRGGRNGQGRSPAATPARSERAGGGRTPSQPGGRAPARPRAEADGNRAARAGEAREPNGNRAPAPRPDIDGNRATPARRTEVDGNRAPSGNRRPEGNAGHAPQRRPQPRAALFAAKPGGDKR